MLACLALGALLWIRHATALTQSLLFQGETIAGQLAVTGRFSVVARDRIRLESLIDGAFQSPDVAYVVFLDPAGETIASRDRLLPAQTHLRLSSPPANVSPDRASISALRFQAGTAFPDPTAPLIPWHALLPPFFERAPARFYDVAVPTRQLSVPPSDVGLLPTPDQPPNQSGRSGSVRVGLSDHRLRQSLTTNALLAGSMLLLVMVAGVAATLLLAQGLTRPLSQMSAAAVRVGSGDLETTLPPSSHDELGGLTDAFNAMTRSLREMREGLDAKVQARTEELSVANRKLEELDRLRRRFVSTASHELRTPLTSIMVYVDNLQDGVLGNLSADQRRVIERIEDNLARLRHLIEELLDLSRIESGAVTLTLAPLSLPELIHRTHEALAPVSAEKHLSIHLHLSHEVPTIRGDAVKLEQVLTNLLHNAVKFSPPGGAIAVALSRTNEHAVIQIRDEGCGIPPEDLDHVFLPFYRSQMSSEQQPGAGLGLSIARHLVELHGGTLTAESEPAHGSTFTLALPFVPPAVPPAVMTPLGAI